MGYESLFTPFKIGNMEVKNRIGLSPMGTNSAFTNGRKDAQEIDYFIERAKGGTGILYMGCQMLNEQIAQGSMEGYLDTYTVLPSLTSVCDGCHRYGAKIVCQISPGTGRNAFPDTFGNPPISASALPSVFNPDVICHALTKEEIAQMMEGFKFAAGVASDAGFDAIEIHAHAGYLIDQFMSPVWNKRTDEYGGSPENCARFPKEIVEAIKSVFGVNKGRDAAPPLRFGYGVDGQRRLSGAFRPIDFDDAAFRITAHAECIIESNAPRRNDFNIFDFLVV